MMKGLNQEQSSFLNSYANEWIFNKETGLVDCKDFYAVDKDLMDFCEIEFGVCSGNFSIHRNFFTSLVGSPREVFGYFDCADNMLTSLDGCPISVGSFSCYFNGILSLKVLPEIIRTSLDCRGNKLRSLEGCPKIINGSFNCGYNDLVTLEGGPEVVNGSGYNCNDNLFVNLIGAPKRVKYFDCSGNTNLVSFDGCPEIIEGNCCFNDMPQFSIEDFFNARFNYVGCMNIDKREIISLSYNSIVAKISGGISYNEAVLKAWSEFCDIEKKTFINDLPGDGLGKVIKKTNKFGMII